MCFDKSLILTISLCNTLSCVLFACKLLAPANIFNTSATYGSTVWDNIIKMVSGTDEPLSVGYDEPHFAMQFDIILNGHNIY